MLLGENGTGKTSVLQAIALTLAGPQYLAKLAARPGFNATELLRSGSRETHIAVKTSGFTAAHEITLRSGRARYRNPNGDTLEVTLATGRTRSNKQDARRAEGQLVILAYGATRLLPRSRARRYGTEYVRIDNLFDPFLPLLDAARWLGRLKSTAFDRVALILKDLLALDREARLVRHRGQVLVEIKGATATLGQLSDGYQSVVAAGVDILEVIMRLWPRLEDAEGIVLIDEIGSHLHPTWKMRVVTSLRRALPRMQFIATTHDPLCLRGLGEGEVAVMQRNDAGHIVAVTDLPSPADFRVDQLLTSEFFGLSSTVDPESEQTFDEYYALLALQERTNDQQLRLATLKETLKDRRYLGNTPREHLMYEAVDRLIAQNRLGERKRIPELNAAARQEIERIWNTGSPGDPP